MVSMKSAKFNDRGFQRFATAAAASEFLSAEREAELVQRAAKGDVKAEEVLIKAHIRLVIRMASPWAKFGHPLDELVAAGNLGLVKGAQRFDPTKDNRFSTYVGWWIKAEIGDYIQNNASAVKIPNNVRVKKSFYRGPKLRRELEAQGLGEAAIISKMAETFDIDEKQMADIVAARTPAKSMSAPASGNHDEGSLSFGDLIADESPSPEEMVIEADSQDHNVRRLKEILAKMNERDSDILRCRRLIDEPMTLEALAEKYSVSRERIRQIEVRAMDKVREALLAA